MGNFSRDTFNPSKNYVGVRLQQGVPLVDADWNELNDVLRNELYKSLNLTINDGVPLQKAINFDNELRVTAGDDFFVPLAGDNDFYVLPGEALIQGRYVNVPQPQRVEDLIRYSAQPWTNSDRADEDGVDVVPQLTTPTDARTDIVYLDVWEREVDSIEDSNLVNSAIGIETCIRLKREVTIRVAEGTTDIPTAPKGHAFMPLALLNRPAGQASLTGEGVIQDIRPRIHGTKGIRTISFPPLFMPVNNAYVDSDNPVVTEQSRSNPLSPWLSSFGLHTTDTPRHPEFFKFFALKVSGVDAHGVIPINLPQGAFLIRLKIWVYAQGPVRVRLLQISHRISKESYTDLLDPSRSVLTPLRGERDFTFSPITFLVNSLIDNNLYYYCLYINSGYLDFFRRSDYIAQIHGISMEYEF